MGTCHQIPKNANFSVAESQRLGAVIKSPKHRFLHCQIVGARGLSPLFRAVELGKLVISTPIHRI